MIPFLSLDMRKAGTQMFGISREACAPRLALRPREGLLVVALLTVLVWGMTSAQAFSSGGQTASPPSVGSSIREIRVRKSVTALTPAERKEFVDAVAALKRAKSPHDASLSYYDQFVQWHKDRYVCHAVEHQPSTNSMPMVHLGPMFLPWHREFLMRFEGALRDVSGKAITVPYWDWTDPQSVSPDHPNALFREDFMGGNGNPDEQYAVTTGPFKKGAWTLNVHPEGASWVASATTYLTRRLSDVIALPKIEEVKTASASDEYDVPPYTAASEHSRSFRNAIEGNVGFSANWMHCGSDGWMAMDLSVPGRTNLHNGVHLWVGGLLSPPAAQSAIYGTMVLPTSPNDPIFFLHHANIDRLWALWQVAHPGKPYEPRSGYPGNNADSAMTPFGDVSPQRVEDISSLGYRYR